MLDTPYSMPTPPGALHQLLKHVRRMFKSKATAPELIGRLARFHGVTGLTFNGAPLTPEVLEELIGARPGAIITVQDVDTAIELAEMNRYVSGSSLVGGTSK